MVNDPLGTRTAALVTDGARHRHDPRRRRLTIRTPVHLLNAAAGPRRHRGHAPTYRPAVQSGGRPSAQAGDRPTSTLQVYDASRSYDLFPRGPRLCAKGEGGSFVEGGRIAPGGALAVNTSGAAS
jgi:hypothetical protein